jgi:glycosyltransferase involved in cell wall biosynthesis
VSKSKILHITPWYPTEEDPGFAIWIRRQIESLESFDNDVIHIQIIPNGLGLSSSEENGIKRIKLHIPTASWRIRELKFFFLLCWQLLWKYRTKDYRCVNFHIAYPSCVYLYLIRRFIKCPIVITEHWSYYHFHFFSKKKLTRIKKIFSHDIPIITVSQALYEDIRAFSGHSPSNYILPNVVDTGMFQHTPGRRIKNRFFMVSFWRDHKQPLEVLEAIRQIKEEISDIKLYIGGYGPLMVKMQAYVNEHSLADNCTFLGQLSSEQIAEELNRCSALIHPTIYETFSVVCAEAQCCGTPVITNPVGALPEYLNESNALLREENQSWSEALFLFNQRSYDHAKIAYQAARKFDKNVIGSAYETIIDAL